MATQLVAPEPQFQIGDTIWTPGYESETRTFDCPDCLNTRVWKIATPAGHEIETSCKRCSPGFVSSRDLPSLKYQAFKAVAYSRRVTGLETSAAGFSWGDDLVKYKCYTSPGGGHIVDAKNAYASEREALAVAEIDVAKRNAAIEAKPSVIEAKRLSDLDFPEAQLDVFKSGLWDSWYAYRRLREDIESFVADDAEPTTLPELLDALRETIEWDVKHRDLPALSALIATAEQVAADDPQSPLVSALARLPLNQRAALAA